MLDFVAGYSKKVSEGTINEDLFTRKFDKPLVDCLVDACKGMLSVVPGLEFDGYEYVTDMAAINLKLNKRNIKDKQIKNDNMIDSTYNINETYYGLLIFKIKKYGSDGRSEIVERPLLVPKPFKGQYFLINGKLALPTLQVVNNSTYVTKGSLKFKTSLFPLSLQFAGRTIICESAKESFKVNKFTIDLFGKKEYNPLLFFMAQMGLEDTIRYFDLDGIVGISETMDDPDNYLYFKGNKNFYVEVHKEIFQDNDLKFIREIVGTFIDLFAVYKPTLKELFDIQFWTFSLGGIFGKPSVRKGSRSLLSFSKMLDENTKKSLKLSKVNKANSFALLRWLMTDYHNLIKKDNLDTDNCRVRVNEYIAYYFDNLLTKNINSIFNGEKITDNNLNKLLNSINHWALIRAMRKGSASGSLLRFERFNDFDAIPYTSYSEKGPSGQMGGKHKTKLDSRNVNPSQLGVFDLNVVSANDPGMTGTITANVKIYNGTHFSNIQEPQTYFAEINELKDIHSVDGVRHNERHDLLNIKGYIFNPENRMYTLQYSYMAVKELEEELKELPFRQGDQLDAEGIKLNDRGQIQYTSPLQLVNGIYTIDSEQRTRYKMHRLAYTRTYHDK